MKKNLLLHLFLSSFFLAFGQSEENSVPFNGLITDMTGNPAKGAKIYIVKDYCSRSDKQGRFGLTNVRPNDTIVVEYQKKVYLIPVEGRKSISIKIGDQVDNRAVFEAQEDMELLSFGYGYVKRREKTTSGGGISGEALRRSGCTNLLDALKGRFAGVMINGNKILIRGINSVNSGTDPLILIDGIESSSLDNVSLNDVERVEILKEGSMYGMRGSNGVILVYTINGRK